MSVIWFRLWWSVRCVTTVNSMNFMIIRVTVILSRNCILQLAGPKPVGNCACNLLWSAADILLSCDKVQICMAVSSYHWSTCLCFHLLGLQSFQFLRHRDLIPLSLSPPCQSLTDQFSILNDWFHDLKGDVWVALRRIIGNRLQWWEMVGIGSRLCPWMGCGINDVLFQGLMFCIFPL